MIKRVVVTDLDNTLFDWVGIWHSAFSSMLEELVALSGIERQRLEAEFKAIHKRHGTTEYAFSIEELPSLAMKHPGEDVKELYKGAIAAYRVARQEKLQPFPDVVEMLLSLKDRGCLLVGYTESMAFYSMYRMRHLGLDRILDYLYSPPDHDLPRNMTAEQTRRYPESEYRLRRTIHRHTPRGELKPNRGVLLDILRDVGAEPEEALYLGDSLWKDIPGLLTCPRSFLKHRRLEMKA